MELKERNIYNTLCGCVVYILDQREPSGYIMRPQEYRGYQMFRGKFMEVCSDEHANKRTSWNKWRSDGVWYNRVHGQKEPEEKKELNIVEKAKYL